MYQCAQPSDRDGHTPRACAIPHRQLAYGSLSIRPARGHTVFTAMRNSTRGSRNHDSTKESTCDGARKARRIERRKGACRKTQPATTATNSPSGRHRALEFHVGPTEISREQRVLALIPHSCTQHGQGSQSKRTRESLVRGGRRIVSALVSSAFVHVLFVVAIVPFLVGLVSGRRTLA